MYGSVDFNYVLRWIFYKMECGKAGGGESHCLSSAGTVLTAALTCLCCYFFLRIDILESFLIGAVVSSTDAASVFSILRSKKFEFKGWFGFPSGSGKWK